MFARKTTNMKNLYLFLLLSLALSACRFNFDLDFSGPDDLCKEVKTSFSFKVEDYYSRQPVPGAQLKVIKQVNYCAWCPLPDTILTANANAHGEFVGNFQHDLNSNISYTACIVMPESYFTVRPFLIGKGCDNAYWFALKPKSKLGIWIKNTTDEAVFLDQISIAQRLELPDSEKDPNDPSQQTFKFFQAVHQSIPGHSNWQLFWFDALPEEKIEINLTFENRNILTEQFTTSRDSTFYYKIRIR